jgi:hypothetical protein
MPILGGSPLGLIGVLSGPTRDGMSTFNGGKSRNVNVNLYNAGKEGDKQKLGEYEKKNDVKKQKGGAFSIFTGGNFIKPWANITYPKNVGVPKLDDEGYSGVSRRTLHNNDVYDTSILNIIEKTAGTSCRLRPTDFAYLKDLGVYPNNRLMIARRFSGPQTDDIYRGGSSPMAIMMTWKAPGEDFLDISFGEEWEEAKADFTEMLNKIAEDLTGKKLGGVGAIPLPGWTEGLQNAILAELGIKTQESTKDLPAGNPNLIKQAKRRKTVPYGEAGSGLKATVQVKMTCEYEQKFISGIDPTIVWMDIISNALRFGTSPSVDFGLDPTFANKIASWVTNPEQLITDIVAALTNALNTARNFVTKLLNDDVAKADDGSPKEPGTEPSEKSKAEAIKKKVLGVINKIIRQITSSLAQTVRKYRQEVIGITKALTGMPSTPHHITIGNPLRPMFCAGDMYTDDVKVTLGPNLAFNDLPATIKIDFQLQNARPLGLQEIKAKFNTGNLRTVNVIADSESQPNGNVLPDGVHQFGGNVDKNTTGGSPSATPTTPAGGQNTTSNTTNPGQSASSTTKDGNNQAQVNTNPNSPGPVVENDPNKKTGGSTVSTTGTNASTTGTEGEKQKVETAAKNDPVADANATSKKGYTYRLLDVDENLTLIKVTDKNGVEVLNKKYTPDSFPNFKTVDDSQLIADAKTAVGDI